MKPIHLEPTEDTPKVLFDNTTGTFEISGKSYPEDSNEFYEPLLKWLTEYCKAPQEQNNFVFHFEFLSTSSTKQIMQVFKIIDQLHKLKTVTINWNWDKGDLNMRKTGQLLYQAVAFNMTFNEV